MTPSLYQQVLGDDFAKLAPRLQQLHSGETSTWSGLADVEWGESRWLRGLLHAAVMLRQLPPAGSQQACQITLTRHAQKERWQRRFGRTPMVSKQFQRNSELIEAMGPLHIRLENSVENGNLQQRSSRISWLGIPMPLRVLASETSDGDAMQFDVAIRFASGALLLRYHGQLRKNP